MDEAKKLWNGFPIETYIGGPLQAVVNSQMMMSKSTKDFIEEVGFEETSSPKQTRQSNQSGMMDLNVQAEQSPLPEGLARVIDLMNQAITPRVVHRKPWSKNE